MISATKPAIKKARGAPPSESWTARPSTAKIPPPTIPPIPIAATSKKLGLLLLFSVI